MIFVMIMAPRLLIDWKPGLNAGNGKSKNYGGMGNYDSGFIANIGGFQEQELFVTLALADGIQFEALNGHTLLSIKST